MFSSEMRNESIGGILQTISEYPSIEVVSRLDLAVCDKIKRKVFLIFVQSEKFVIIGGKQQKRDFIKWLSA